jgi:hypothetical protein
MLVSDLNSSNRGEGGFGHTGKKWAQRAESIVHSECNVGVMEYSVKSK